MSKPTWRIPLGFRHVGFFIARKENAMLNNLKTASDLSFAECGALLTLGSRGASASFDLEAMSHLFVDGMIEVSNANRRVVLTTQGDIVYASLTTHRKPNAAWIN